MRYQLLTLRHQVRFFYMNDTTFSSLGIAPRILEILNNLNFKTPTPIQLQSIPVALQGKDVIGIAQTGTGKTFAFGLPMIQRLATTKGQGLVIVPTRELALQVEESLNKIGDSLHLRTATLIGGANMTKQIQAIRRNPHVIIATPGRLNDHLEQKTINLSQVKILVLDEADRMLDMGFKPQIEKALRTIPRDRQTMLFSASMPLSIISIANSYMKTPVQVEVAPSGTTAETVSQEIFFVRKESKLALLQVLLKEHTGTVLIFSRTKHGAKKIALNLRHQGHSATEIHSNKSLNQRIEALDGFKNGRYRILVATDIAARGIDVKDISLVINFDLPDSPEDYVHRIGRTGRAQHEGKAISFATPDQQGDLKTIEKLIKKQVPVTKLPDNLPAPSPANKELSSQRPARNFSSRQAPSSKFGNRQNQSTTTNRHPDQNRQTKSEPVSNNKFNNTAWDDRLMTGPKKYKSPVKTSDRDARRPDRSPRNNQPGSRPAKRQARVDNDFIAVDQPFGMELFTDSAKPQRPVRQSNQPRTARDSRSTKPYSKKQVSSNRPTQGNNRIGQSNLAKFRRESEPSRPRFR